MRNDPGSGFDNRGGPWYNTRVPERGDAGFRQGRKPWDGVLRRPHLINPGQTINWHCYRQTTCLRSGRLRTGHVSPRLTSAGGEGASCSRGAVALTLIGANQRAARLSTGGAPTGSAGCVGRET